MEKTPDAGRACAGGSDREDGAMPSCFSGAGLAAISQGAFPERSRQLFLGRVQRRHIGLKLGGKFLDRKQTPAATRENISFSTMFNTTSMWFSSRTGDRRDARPAHVPGTAGSSAVRRPYCRNGLRWRGTSR